MPWQDPAEQEQREEPRKLQRLLLQDKEDQKREQEEKQVHKLTS